MSRRKILGRIIKETKVFRGLFIFSAVMAAINVIATLTIPVFIGRAIDCMTGAGNVDFNKITFYISIICILILTGAIAVWLMNVSNNYMVYSVTGELKRKSFVRLQKLPVTFFDTKAHGDVVSRVTADTEQFGEGLLLAFTQGLTGVMTLVGTIIFMFSVNVFMTLIVLALSPVALIISSFISKRSYAMFNKKNELRGELTSFFDEAVYGQDVVTLFGMEAKKRDELEKTDEVYKRYDKKAMFYSSLPNPGTRFVYALIYAGLTLGGTFLVIRGSLSIGQMASFLSYATQFTKPFNEITDVSAQLQNAISCAARIFELIDEPCEDEIKEIKSKAKTSKPGYDDFDVIFDNISFSYIPEREVISEFNLRVRKGEKVALVGPTGCGKTTIINLLMRFYDVNKGGIYLKGNDIREMKREELRSHFGMVLQDTWLKKGTIKENICFGIDGSTDEEIIQAARLAYADGFISRLIDGYDTVIDEVGGNLSQGEKQLLCIARIMLAKPEILILDEATSSIDTRTEARLGMAFDALTEGRTSFIVAHRLSTVKNADKIVVMKAGKIIEVGTHTELMKKRGFYHNLVHLGLSTA